MARSEFKQSVRAAAWERCGGDEIKVARDPTAYIGGIDAIGFCKKCGANGANCKTLEEATAAWNRRTQSPAPQPAARSHNWVGDPKSTGGEHCSRCGVGRIGTPDNGCTAVSDGRMYAQPAEQKYSREDLIFWLRNPCLCEAHSHHELMRRAASFLAQPADDGEGELLDNIAAIITGGVTSSCCAKTGGKGNPAGPCDCRDLANDILALLRRSPALSPAQDTWRDQIIPGTLEAFIARMKHMLRNNGSNVGLTDKQAEDLAVLLTKDAEWLMRAAAFFEKSPPQDTAGLREALEIFATAADVPGMLSGEKICISSEDGKITWRMSADRLRAAKAAYQSALSRAPSKPAPVGETNCYECGSKNIQAPICLDCNHELDARKLSATVAADSDELREILAHELAKRYGDDSPSVKYLRAGIDKFVMPEGSQEIIAAALAAMSVLRSPGPAEVNAGLLAALKSAVKIADEAADEWDNVPNGARAGKILVALAGHRKGYRADIDAIHEAIATAESASGKADNVPDRESERVSLPRKVTHQMAIAIKDALSANDPETFAGHPPEVALQPIWDAAVKAVEVQS
jgi:hypothetical protein